MPTDNEFTRILQWPGYRVYQHEIDEEQKMLKLWVRRKRGNRKLMCSGCGRKFDRAHDANERAVRELPWSAFHTTVFIEVFRVKCPECGIKVEKVPLLPGKAPFSQRFEEAVGQACESAAARQVARGLGLAASTVRGIDRRYVERWAASRRKPALRQTGVDEIHLGKKQKFLTVVSNLETSEPLWFGRERKKETLDEFFQTELSAGQRRGIEAARVEMWEPFRLSMEQWTPNCRIVYDKFHVMQHANAAIDEVRRAEFFRKGVEDARTGERQALAVADRLGPSDEREAAGTRFSVGAQPQVVQSVPSPRKSRPALELPLRGSHAALSSELDRPVTMAAPRAIPEVGTNAPRPPGRHPELLPD